MNAKILCDNTTQDATAATAAALGVMEGYYAIGMETAGSPTVTFDFLPASDGELTTWIDVFDEDGEVSLSSTGARFVRLPACRVRAVVASANATAWISPVDRPTLGQGG